MKTDEGTTFTCDEDILNEGKPYYVDLYKSRGTETNKANNEYFFPSEKQCKLSLAEKNICEGNLKEKESLEALKTMENNKSPGNDGIPEEFYKILWNDISYRLGKLPMSQRRGIINLIHKKNTIPYYLKNWRPITLLNCDYKIAAKAIANRSKIVLPSLINNDQTTFLKGRSTSQNIRLIEGILRYTETEDIPGLML